MKCVIISEKKLFDFGKRCLSNLRDLLNDEYFLEYNEVKRLRTIFFMACQSVSGKEWNEDLQQKFWEALDLTHKSKVEDDEAEIEEVFKTPVTDKYTKENFSFEEIYNIFCYLDKGLKRCQELHEDLYYEIKNFEKMHNVFNWGYLDLDS